MDFLALLTDVFRMALISIPVALLGGTIAYVLRGHLPLPRKGLFRLIGIYLYAVVFVEILLFTYALSVLSCPLPSLQTSSYAVDCNAQQVFESALLFALGKFGMVAAILFPGWVVGSYVFDRIGSGTLWTYIVSAYASVLAVMLWIYAFPWLLLRLSF